MQYLCFSQAPAELQTTHYLPTFHCFTLTLRAPKPSSTIIKGLSVSFPKATSGMILFGRVSRQHILTEWHLKETPKCTHHKLALCIIISNLSIQSSENYRERQLFLLTEPKTTTFSPQRAFNTRKCTFPATFFRCQRSESATGTKAHMIIVDAGWCEGLNPTPPLTTWETQPLWRESAKERHETKRQHEAEITDLLPLFGLGKLSCRWKTTFSTKCWMLLCSGPRTNTIQSWVKPSTVGFFLTWARWPSSSFTWTAPCKIKWCWLTTQFQDKFLKTNMN